MIPSKSNNKNFPLLNYKDIHVWNIKLHSPFYNIDAFRQSLSKEEFSRSLKFHFEEDCQKYIIVHGSIRDILARYLNTAASKIQFHYNFFGKPFLKKSKKLEGPISFSLSYSSQWAILVLSRAPCLGVDIEKMIPLQKIESLVNIVLSEREKDLYYETAPHSRQQQFFSIWTAKEAYVKAKGQGLSYPLKKIELPTLYLSHENHTACSFFSHNKENYLLWRFSSIPGYSMAIVAPDADYVVKQHHY